MPADHHVVLVLFDGFQLLDAAGPTDVFAAASRLLGPGAPAYALTMAGPRAGPVRAGCGVTVLADAGFDGFDGFGGQVDTLLVTGGLGLLGGVEADLVEGVRRLAGRARRVASVCSGALVLAEAGLLAGRRATTHWSAAPLLAGRYPDVAVDADRIHVRDGTVWTSAGVSAGTDLALALVADDHGPDLAREVARWLVVYLHRPGGQNQFAAPAPAAAADPASVPGPPRGGPCGDLAVWIIDHPAGDLSLAALAGRAHMSVRHFSRTFTRQVGVPPGRYVEQVRLDAARRILETTDHTLGHVARATGLGSPETLYRVFHRNLSVSPGDYRHRFRAAHPAGTDDTDDTDHTDHTEESRCPPPPYRSTRVSTLSTPPARTTSSATSPG
jgi:transcriptional regulator GlxA family with amidase domain